MVVALLALFIAMAGTGYAATQLPANSVGSNQLKKNAVERVKIKNNAVNGAKVLDGSLAGADIKESSLAKVPSAALADTATTSTHAAAAGALDKATYKTATATAPAGTDSTAATATCDAGQHVVGGGVKFDNPATGLVDDAYPDVGNTAWTAHVFNGPAAAQNFTVYAICIAVSTTG
jgi:hypothetical protein